jgi:small ligand-binding sensory domain FIST
MQGSHGVTGVWKGGWNEAGLSRWADSLRSQLPQSGVTLGLAFLAPSLFSYAEEVLEILRVHGRIPCLAGCSGVGLISGANEFEQGADLVLGLHHLPGATLKGFHFNTEEIEATEDAAAWVQKTGLSPKQVNGWLIFASPFDLNGETWLRQWNKAYPGIPAIGGLASGDFAAQQSQVYFNGEVHEHGLVAVALCGDVTLETVVSQGCTPIGQSWTITRADRNFILGIGNRPAYSVLMETFESLTLEERKKSQNNLFVGLAIDEYQEELQCGDFLVRNLLGGDPKNGTLAIGAFPRAGQTLQFQRRDSETADAELSALLAQSRTQLGGRPIYGGCLTVCNGRGSRLFGIPNHDAGLVQEQLGRTAITGFFGHGELGPVAHQNFLHGYTASLGLFVPKSTPRPG